MVYARVGSAAIGTALLLATFAPAPGAPGDPRIVRGVVEWPTSPEVTPFIVLRGDDGRRYAADVAAAVRGQASPAAGTRVTVAGVEGGRAHEIVAVSLAVEGAGPASAPLPSASPPVTPAEPPSQRIDGRVEGVSGSTLVLAAGDGRRVVVDLASLGTNLAAVRVGDEVTVFGRYDGRRFLANGFMQVEEGAALPRSRR
jgi:hypothetical protein